MGNCRLIYLSTISDKLMSNEELRELVSKSAEHNQALGITGLLVLSGDQFLQVLEGPASAVNDLYSTIVRDGRHHHLRLISYEPAVETYFDDWGMALVDLYDLPKATREILIRKYSSKGDAIQIPERLHELYSFLLDAKHLCSGRPWEG